MTTRNKLRHACIAALGIALAGGSWAAAQEDATRDYPQRQQQQRQQQQWQDVDQYGQQDGRVQQDRRRQQSSQQQQTQTLSGRVIAVQETQHQGGNHVHVRIATPRRGTVTVDLGPSNRVASIADDLNRGDTIRVSGQTQRDSRGEQLFVANQVRANQESFYLGNWWQRERQGQQPQQFGQQRRQDPFGQQQRDQFGQQQQDRDWFEQNRFGSQQQQQQRQQRQQQFGQQQQDWFDDQGMQQDRQQQRAVRQPRQQGQQQQTPDGYIMVHERLIFLISDELNRHLIAARMNLQQDNNQEAATELRLAADYLDMYAGAASDQTRQGQLNQARRQLQQLADRLEQDQSVPASQVDQAVAQAHKALAQHHFAKAERFQEQDESIRAGYGLRQAARHLQQSILWSDQEFDRESNEAIRQANLAASRLIRGQELENPQRIIKALDQQISDVTIREQQDGEQSQSQRQQQQQREQQRQQQQRQEQQREQDQNPDRDDDEN